MRATLACCWSHELPSPCGLRGQRGHGAGGGFKAVNGGRCGSCGCRSRWRSSEMRPPSSFSESAYMGLGEVSSQSNFWTIPHKRVLVRGGVKQTFRAPRGASVPSHGLLGKKVDRGCGITIRFEVIFLCLPPASCEFPCLLSPPGTALRGRLERGGVKRQAQVSSACCCCCCCCCCCAGEEAGICVEAGTRVRAGCGARCRCCHHAVSERR